MYPALDSCRKAKITCKHGLRFTAAFTRNQSFYQGLSRDHIMSITLAVMSRSHRSSAKVFLIANALVPVPFSSS